MKITWRTEWPQWVLLVGMFLLAAVTWSWAPEQIPVRWDVGGEVSSYGGKVEALLGPPLLALGLYLLLVFLPRVDPGRANYAQFSGAYTAIRASVLAMLAIIYGLTHLWIRGRQIDIATAVPLLTGALFFVLGTLMGKVRPNWFVGIRTPWTLSSKLSWVKTHRLGGWVFMGMGVLMMAVAVLRAPPAAAALGIVVTGGVVWLLVYSYLMWRADPDKIPPAGTLPAGEGTDGGTPR